MEVCCFIYIFCVSFECFTTDSKNLKVLNFELNCRFLPILLYLNLYDQISSSSMKNPIFMEKSLYVFLLTLDELIVAFLSVLAKNNLIDIHFIMASVVTSISQINRDYSSAYGFFIVIHLKSSAWLIIVMIFVIQEKLFTFINIKYFLIPPFEKFAYFIK